MWNPKNIKKNSTHTDLCGAGRRRAGPISLFRAMPRLDLHQPWLVLDPRAFPAAARRAEGEALLVLQQAAIKFLARRGRLHAAATVLQAAERMRQRRSHYERWRNEVARQQWIAYYLRAGDHLEARKFGWAPIHEREAAERMQSAWRGIGFRRRLRARLEIKASAEWERYLISSGQLDAALALGWEPRPSVRRAAEVVQHAVRLRMMTLTRPPPSPATSAAAPQAAMAVAPAPVPPTPLAASHVVLSAQSRSTTTVSHSFESTVLEGASSADDAPRHLVVAQGASSDEEDEEGQLDDDVDDGEEGEDTSEEALGAASQAELKEVGDGGSHSNVETRAPCPAPLPDVCIRAESQSDRAPALAEPGAQPSASTEMPNVVAAPARVPALAPALAPVPAPEQAPVPPPVPVPANETATAAPREAPLSEINDDGARGISPCTDKEAAAKARHVLPPFLSRARSWRRSDGASLREKRSSSSWVGATPFTSVRSVFSVVSTRSLPDVTATHRSGSSSSVLSRLSRAKSMAPGFGRRSQSSVRLTIR